MAIKKTRISKSEKKAPTKGRKKPTKKVVFIELDEEITTIFSKIAKCAQKNVYLVVPQRAVLFQSPINLKILKRKAEDADKNIFIITNDSNGINLAGRVGIVVYDKLEGEEHPSLVEGKLQDSGDISPLKASINSVDEVAPSRRNEKKLSISELVKRRSSKASIVPRGINLVKASGDKKRAAADKKKPGLVLTAPNKKALFSLVAISALILLVISYIALPGATLVLTPKSNSLKVSTNVVLADYERNRAELDTRPPKTIPSYKITTEIDRIFEYQSTGKDFQGSNASGIIEIRNTSSNDWPLVPRTRFQTSDGLVYRLGSQVTVPPGSTENPGILQVQVTADELDAFDQPVGARGNLAEETQFFLPGLSAENQKRLFAVSVGAFEGGVTNVIKLIDEEDIDAARAKMESELRSAAIAELQSALDDKNKEQKTSLALLADESLIVTSDPDIDIPGGLVGQKLDSFEVKGRIIASGVAYDKQELLSIMKSELIRKKNPEKSLAFIDEESLTFQVAEVDEAAGKVKITPTIQAIEEFEINPNKENGERFMKQVKEAIVGNDVRDAEAFIQNLPEIENVDIHSWPAWAPTLPSVPDNIRVEIKRD